MSNNYEIIGNIKSNNNEDFIADEQTIRSIPKASLIDGVNTQRVDLNYVNRLDPESGRIVNETQVDQNQHQFKKKLSDYIIESIDNEEH